MSHYNKVFPTYRYRDTCLACASEDIVTYLTLGNTALANSYLESDEVGREEFTAPLELGYCRACHLAQLRHIVDRRSLFEQYAYFSSTSPQLFTHFENYAQKVFNRFPNQAKRLVVEIASNDGILLKFFKKLGARVLGIEPAVNIADFANRDGILTIPVFFDSSIVAEIIAQHGKAGIISANNVLAHTDVLRDMIDGVSRLLAPDGVFVFEVQYILDLLRKNEFDNIYHEHTSYFSLHPLVRLMEEFGMRVTDVEHVETQGGSLRVYAAHRDSYYVALPIVEEVLANEREAGLIREDTYHDFNKKPILIRESLFKLLSSLKAQGKRIAGYGAAAKGTTLLQYAGVGLGLIDYITDTAPSKQGKFMPGTHIPIVYPERLKIDTPDYILIIAWNYAASIIQKEKWFCDRGGRFIIPVPEPHIV